MVQQVFYSLLDLPFQDVHPRKALILVRKRNNGARSRPKRQPLEDVKDYLVLLADADVANERADVEAVGRENA